MSRAARTRRRRIQPYAWLGAGAVTLGLGVGVVSGTAVAFADADAGAASGSNTASNSATTSSSSNAGPARGDSAATKKAATRGGRAAVAPTVADTQSSGNRVTAPAASAATPAVATGDASTADVTEPITPRSSARRPARAAAAATLEVSSPTVTVPTPEPSGSSAPAAVVPLPAADPAPAPNMESWLPNTPIVPGDHIKRALQELTDAGQALQAGTWGQGNVIAGLAAIVPQIFLSGAALSINLWQATSPIAQGFLAATAGIPIIAQVAQTNLIVNTWLTNIAQLSMGGAQLFLPVVSLLGAPAAAQAAGLLVADARADGTVYAVVPLQIKASTQPVANVSINNGGRVPLLVDTGASGIVVLRDAVPVNSGLVLVGDGDSCFSGGLCYHYVTYRTTVDLGGGAVTDTGLVNVVTNNNEYPTSEADFAEYFSWGADGILGVGANTAGPGPAPIPNTTLPGELSDGVLIMQNLLPFGLGGVLVFGPNPLPTRVSLPGAPDAYIKVSVNGAPQTTSGAIIDSGGVFGTIAAADVPAGVTPVTVGGVDYLPAGTVLRAYSPTGTLLYTYSTGAPGDYGTPIIATGLMNTGNAPYAQNPVYLNYANLTGSGIGSTDFSIW